MIKEKKDAYLIMAHDNVEQLNMLIMLLDSSHNDIYLHIDQKSSIKKGQIFHPKISNLKIIERMSVYWADFSQVECELSLLAASIPHNYRYYHLLSGQDLPLKNNEYIYHYFDNSKLLYLHYTTDEKLKGALEYVRYYHVFQKRLSHVNRGKNFSIYKVFNKLYIIIQKICGINRTYYYIPKKGANWFSIPHDFAELVLSKRDTIIQRFSSTRSPDEFFLQTLAYEHYPERIFRFLEDDNYESCLRFIDWNKGNPYIFRTEDFKSLMESPQLFARKFDMKTDPRVIEMLIHSIK